MAIKKPTGRNQTIVLTPDEIKRFQKRTLRLKYMADIDQIINHTICQDLFKVIPLLPSSFTDLLFIDPPYNMSKRYNANEFKKKTLVAYMEWIDSWLSQLVRLLKPEASVYICSDWQSSTAVHQVAQNYFKIRNRITWEREKGRGAKTNWKNNSEDIWFCTVSNKYTFNLDAVKLKRRVIAPYTHHNGEPKDWEKTDEGNYRLTHPSNLWTNISVPFWSMPENTDHPTQKPEKLLAQIILASTKPGDVVFDPFAGSGTALVTAKKLERRFVGVELDKTYCCLTEKRLEMAESDRTIQGYADGVFWERNSSSDPNYQRSPAKRCKGA